MTSESREDDEAPGQGMGRLLALTDGVFAFAITLLVLSLSVVPGQPLQVVLPHLAPRVWEAALSFAVIGRFWMIHRRLFTRIRHHDEVLIGLNFAFLATIVAMPFATQLLAHPGCQPVQVMVYAATIGAAALLSSVLCAYAWTKGRLVDPELPASPDGRAVLASGLRGLVAVVICVVSIALTAASPTAGELFWITFLLPNRWTIPWLRPVARRLLQADRRRPVPHDWLGSRPGNSDRTMAWPAGSQRGERG